MKYTLLLPRACRIIGLILLPFAIMLLCAVYMRSYSISFLKWNDPPKQTAPSPGTAALSSAATDVIFGQYFSADLTGEVALLLTFTCLFFIAFSKQKHEDEYSGIIRLRALQISVYANYIILALSSIIIYGLSFLMVMEVNLFTILVIFIIVFYFQLHISPVFKSRSHEKLN